MELVRDKNVATYIYFPLVDADGDAVSAAGSLDSEIDTWDDGTAPDGFTDCTNESTEIGATGIYYLSLTQSEMNHDYIYIQVKSDNAKTQHILINTRLKEAVDTIDSNVDAILVDTGTTLDGKLDTIDGIVDNILVDTGTTLDGKINTIDTVVDAIKAKTDNLPADPASETNVDANETKIDTIDTVVDAIKAKTDNLPASPAPANEYDAQLDQNLSTTESNIRGADSDTLKTLSDQIDGVGGGSCNFDATYQDKVDRVLGLVFENMVTEFTFTGEDNTSAGVWIYDSKAHATTHDKSTGLVGYYSMTCAFTSGKPTTMRWYKES